MRRAYLLLIVLAGCEPQKNEPPPPTPTTTPTQKAADTKAKDPAPTPKADPKGTVTGTLKDKPFAPDAVIIEGKRLTFRTGKEFFADMEVSFDLPTVEAKKWTFGGEFGQPALHLAVREGKELPKVEFVWAKDYKMTLELKAKADGKMAGRIELEVSKPAGTKLVGDFVAQVKKTVNDPLDAEDAPYIHGKVEHAGGWPKSQMSIGFVAKVGDKSRSNSASMGVGPDAGGWMTNTSFKPQLSSIIVEGGPRYRHTGLTPGTHIVYAKKDDVLVVWKTVEVKAGDQLTVDLTFDPAKAGRVVVTVPPAKQGDSGSRSLNVRPADLPWVGRFDSMFQSVDVKEGEKSAKLDGLPPGKYTIYLDDDSAEVEVVAGKESAVTLMKK